jgi:hypothetical protein
VILCNRETRKLQSRDAIRESIDVRMQSRIDGIGNECNPKRVPGIQEDMGIKRIVIKWAQRIYVVERRIELFHGEQELGEEAKTRNITGKDR